MYRLLAKIQSKNIDKEFRLLYNKLYRILTKTTAKAAEIVFRDLGSHADSSSKRRNFLLKIAYICLCHTDPEFVARTAKILQYGDDAFFIHVDGKKEIAPFLAACEGLSNVRFVEKRTVVRWGGFSSVTATVNALKTVLAEGDYDRFVLLQGQDYPLVSPKKIHDFFEVHPQAEFCKGRSISDAKEKKDYMKCCGYWIFDYKNSKNVFGKALRLGFVKFNSLGIKYRPARFRSKGEVWDVYHGWAQFALTRECVQYLIDAYDTNHAYNRFMKHRFPPDEIYFHTLIHNSPFREKVPTDTIVRRSGEKTLLNLTYFEYPTFVTLFTEKEDYDWLKDTGCLFVRKLNSKSAALADEIDRHILSDETAE